jgi:hypothetical protein
LVDFHGSLLLSLEIPGRFGLAILVQDAETGKLAVMKAMDVPWTQGDVAMVAMSGEAKLPSMGISARKIVVEWGVLPSGKHTKSY